MRLGHAPRWLCLGRARPAGEPADPEGPGALSGNEIARRPANVGRVNWIDAPFNRWAYRHVREVARTAVIRRRGQVRALPYALRDIDGVEFEHAGRTWTVAEMLAATYTDALVVWDGQAVVADIYRDGMRDDDTHLCMSVSKSLTSTLAAVLIERGEISREATVPDYITELRGTSWEGCTVQHVMDMRAGTDFDEDDYGDPESPGRVIEEVSDYVPRTRADIAFDTATWIAELPNVRAHGDRFQYRSILTDVLAWVIERVTDRPFTEVMSDGLWGKIGAEYDADFMLDASGFPLADGGVCCTARDLLRFGIMLLDGGIVDGQTVVPGAWLADLRQRNDDAIAAFHHYADSSEPNACYRDMWWITDAEAGVYAASGINGQALRIDHVTGTVIAKFSTWPERWDDEIAALTDAALPAIAAACSRL